MHIERYFLGIWVENEEIRWKIISRISQDWLV